MKKLLIVIIALSVSLFAEQFSIVEKVKVQKSVPYSSYEEIQVPYENCYIEEYPVYQQVPSTQYVGQTYDSSGALIGGALGGVLGHQIGGGSGKVAATIGGAVLGTMIGSGPNRNVYRTIYNTQVVYKNVRKCDTNYRIEQREIKGYTLYGTYKGHEISKFSETNDKEMEISIDINY